MTNPMDMTGRTVLVTGASSGLGRDIAVLLSELGAKVIASGRREDALQATLASLTGEGHAVAPFDLADLDGVPAWMKSVAERFGPLHGLVHSAGIATTRPLRMTTAAHLDEVLRPNVLAAFALSRGFRQRGVYAGSDGRIVYLSSVAGLTGSAGLAIYSASKGALVAMARSLAVELAPEGITVNCLAPGHVEAGMAAQTRETMTEAQYAALKAKHPLGLGHGRDVANAAAFLLAGTGRWITGSTLLVDGGYTAL